MKILALCGSLRRESYNRKLLGAVAEELPAGVELEPFEGLAEIPPYSEDADVEPAPAPVARLREAIAAADGLLVATPEYNGSVPGQLKNALDWASRPFPDSCLRDKPSAVVGASLSPFGAVWAQAELRKVLQTAKATVVDREAPVGQASACFDERGRLVDDEARARVRDVAQGLLELIEARSAERDELRAAA